MDWKFIIGFAAILVSAVIICLVCDRIQKRKREREFKQLLEDAKAAKVSHEKPESGVITINNDGFSVTVQCRRKHEAQVKWDEVDQILAYKRDMFTTDLICWGFYNSKDDRTVEVNEDMVGFKELKKTVETRFGVKEEDWFNRVAIPAFATNMTIIWAKEESNRQNA